jgi:DNA-binding XRE family transcriptional regulator
MFLAAYERFALRHSRLRELREAAGLTQAELASRARVSRQMVGAVEGGHHLPRVDAAMSLATALGTDVRSLFGSDSAAVDAISGLAPREDTLVRAGWVGEVMVTAPVRSGSDGWDVADGVVENDTVRLLSPIGAGLVVAGCEPGLVLVERLLREAGMGGVAVDGSSASAVQALRKGRLHAAVVHGPVGGPSPLLEDAEVIRFHLARWQVGLAGPAEAPAGWWEEALAGKVDVIQREHGAEVQHAFERAAQSVPAPGPRVGTHLDSARLAAATGLAGVTIEPAALAVGAVFHPLEVHVAEMWVAADWVDDPVVEVAMTVVTSRRFQRRLAGVGGYDLDGCGTRAA